MMKQYNFNHYHIKIATLILLLCVIEIKSYAGNEIKFQKDLECTNTINGDTIVVNTQNQSGKLQEIRYPINASIKYSSNLDSLILQTVKSKYINDSLTIEIIKYSFGKIVEVELIIAYDSLIPSVYIWNAMSDKRQKMEIKKSLLTLSQSIYSSNSMLEGELQIEFSGNDTDEILMEDTIIKGEITGCFSVYVDNIQSRRTKY